MTPASAIRDGANTEPADVVRIPLGRGRGHALVDAADVIRIAGYRWHLSSGGYVCAWHAENGKTVATWMHRLILPPPDGLTVDHINGNKLDNRKINLRVANHRQQQANASRRSWHGYRGVNTTKGSGRWYAYIREEGGRRISLGRFPTAEAAARAYDKAAIELFGEYALGHLNFPEEHA